MSRATRRSSDACNRGRQGEGRARGHNEKGTSEIALAFLNAVIPEQLGPAGAFRGSSQWKRLKRRDGWLDNPQTYEVAAYPSYRGSKREAIWLPNEEVALLWQGILKP